MQNVKQRAQLNRKLTIALNMRHVLKFVRTDSYLPYAYASLLAVFQQLVWIRKKIMASISSSSPKLHVCHRCFYRSI